MYKIEYGKDDKYIDITSIVLQRLIGLRSDGCLVAYIPPDDVTRACLFTDPVPFVKKNIRIYKDNILIRIVDTSESYEIILYVN